MEIKELNLEDIKIDLRYQRDIRMNIVNKIVNNFDENKLGTITVAKRGKSYYCVDGQHRLTALKKLHKDTIMAQITNPKNEAQLFIDLNTTRTAPNSYDIYKAKIQAGDEQALELDKALKSINYRMADKNATDRFTIKCPNLAQKIFNKHGKDHLIRIFLNLNEVFEQERGSNSESVISGLSYFFLHTKIKNDDFVKKMRKYTLRKLKMEASDFKLQYRMPTQISYAKAFEKLYNLGRKKKIYMEHDYNV